MAFLRERAAQMDQMALLFFSNRGIQVPVPTNAMPALENQAALLADQPETGETRRIPEETLLDNQTDNGNDVNLPRVAATLRISEEPLLDNQADNGNEENLPPVASTPARKPRSARPLTEPTRRSTRPKTPRKW